MKILMILAPVVFGFVAAVAFIWIAGAFIPRDHVASRSLRVRQTPETIWALITDFEKMHTWRDDVSRHERLPDRDGHPVWREFGKGMNADGMSFEWIETTPHTRLVGRIADDALPFGGTWTFEISHDAGCTILKITESGFITPAPFRYIAKLMGYDATIKRYLTNVAKKFAETPDIT